MNGRNTKKRKRRLFAGLLPIFKKECIHIFHNPLVITLAIVAPLFNLILVGFAIDVDIKQINTVVYDLANTQDSHRLIDRFVNTNDFRIVKRASSDEDLYNTITSGDAKVGIKIPVDYSRRLLSERSASVLVLVDGSNATLTTEAVNVSNRIALEESLKRLLAQQNKSSLPVEMRASVLFNPAARTRDFLIPGLIDFSVPLTIVTLIAFSIVGEREKGTLEQLYMTPISPLGVMIGKMIPYAIIGMVDIIGFLIAMRYWFDVPIHGNVFLLLLLSLPFLIANLALGLIISTQAKTQVDALQQVIVLRFVPGVYLSTYLFPMENLGKYFQWISRVLPDPYYVEILRGIILRGAGFKELWFNGLVMLIMGIAMLLVAAALFRNTARSN